jgi:hypothetical protein
VKGCATGIFSEGAVSVSGGKVRVSKASSVGVNAEGGKILVTGGAVSAQCTAANKYALYSVKGISNKPSCLKSCGN